MGVPKFFRYISERYPCLSEFCLEDKIPQFDNLYLDMNGIIHNCSHPEDGNVHFRITEETIFKDIFKYIDKLFYLIKPQKLFFMAVDGVAPRAKMNQQRSRRFRSAKESETLIKNAEKRGEKLPDEARFDSNCITPGTEFMVRLQNALKYFVKFKISTNPNWRNCRIILSGHETPGEGEHKIMEYIRYLKSLPGYDVNTRHCLYGLDADLIILGLCTHELHFSLLREEVKFRCKSKSTTLEDTKFFLLHLGLLREYIELEFYELKHKIRDFDIEKIIDDWILMGFLVGNDFIPHLPNLHINTNALPILYKCYIIVRSKLDGYINETGKLKLDRLEQFFEQLAIFERENFEQISTDLRYFQAKFSDNYEDELPEAFNVNVDDIKNSSVDNDLVKLMKDTEMFLEDENDESISDEQLLDEEFTVYKKNYYIEKLKYEKVTPEVIIEQTECYIRALQWILYYYYCGVPSWEWFYPHHYAPFVSDLKNFRHLDIKFEIGKPFLPYEQLLAVLPAASKDLLPEAYRDLMVNPESELIEYYPKDFKTDLNGKKQDWEAVVLIPFIDEKILLNSMNRCNDKLSLDEIIRNKHGPMLQYDYTKQSQGTCDGLHSLTKLNNVFCTEKEVWREDIILNDQIKSENILPKKGVLRGVYFPGFPTMKHLEYTAELRPLRVKVFDQPSRSDNMILLPKIREDDSDFKAVAQKFLNKEVFICWPHLTQAKIIAVSTRGKRIGKDGAEINQNENIYELNKKAIIDHHVMRMGIDFRDLDIFVHALPSIGSEYILTGNGMMTLKKIWSTIEIAYPAQGVVSDISTYNPEFIKYKRVEEIFPVDSTVFMLGEPFSGSEGKVIDPLIAYDVGRIKIILTVPPEPDFLNAKQLQNAIEKKYVNTYEASTILGIQANCLARVTGSIFAIEGVRRHKLPDNTPKLNIGLQLKSPKNNEELSGYMRKSGNIWFYSPKAISLVKSYYNRFPIIFELISSSNMSKDIYFESDLFPEKNESGDNLRELVAWIKSQDHNKSERLPCGTQIMEKEAVECVIDSVEKSKTSPHKNIKLQVKPHLIFKPGLKISETKRNKNRPLNLFDRVSVIRNTYQVPVGYKGTIVAIYPLVNQNSVRYENVSEIVYFYDVLFDKALVDGSSIHGLGENRVFKISENSILVINTKDPTKKEVPTNEINTPVNDNTKTKPELFSSILRKSSNDNSSYNKEIKLLEKTNHNNGVPLLENQSSSEFSTKRSKFYNNNKIIKQNGTKNNKNKDFHMNFDNDRLPPPLIPIAVISNNNAPVKQLLTSSSSQHLEDRSSKTSSEIFNENVPKSFEFISKQEFLNPPINLNKRSLKTDAKDQNKNINEILNISSPKTQLNKMNIQESFANKKLNITSQKETETNNRTNILRQLLKLDASKQSVDTQNISCAVNKSDTLNQHSVNTPSKNFSSTNNKLKNVSMPKLPPPPQNWRQDASLSKIKHPQQHQQQKNSITQGNINTSTLSSSSKATTPLVSQFMNLNQPKKLYQSNNSSATNTFSNSTYKFMDDLSILQQQQYQQKQPLYYHHNPYIFLHQQQNQQQLQHCQQQQQKQHQPQFYNQQQQQFCYQQQNQQQKHHWQQYDKPQNQHVHQFHQEPLHFYQQQNYKNPTNETSLFTKVPNIDFNKGQSAFIPLQALKNLKKLEEKSKTQKDINECPSSNENTQQHVVGIPINAKLGAYSKHPINSETDKKALNSPSRSRPPKIAAKFDHQYLS